MSIFLGFQPPRFERLGTNLLPNWDHLRFEVCLGHRFNLGPHVAWHQPPDTTTTDAGFEQRYVGPEIEATLECRCAKERKERNLGEKGWICLGGIFLGKRANYTWYTSRAARGGGGSFKNRKCIGEIGCCESRITKRKHWWIWLTAELSNWLTD